MLNYRLYQAAGVKYYCMVNPETNSAEVFELVNHRYEEQKDFLEKKMVFDLGPCTIAFDFGELFNSR
jgi:Uma2 family endonuclease